LQRGPRRPLDGSRQIVSTKPTGTPAATADFVRHEAALWKRVIADADS
jgi:hypothetical protein